MTDALHSSQGPTPVEGESSQKPGGSFARALIIAVGLIAAVLTVHLTPIRAWISDVQRLRDAVRGLGLWVYPAAIIVVAVLISCGVPRLLFCAIGGAIFGFWVGLLITQIGTLIGHYGVFLFVRWGGRDWALARWPKLRRWADLMKDQGIVGVILLRQLPVHSMLENLALGLSHLKHRQFLIGTAIGILPEAIPATLIGAGLVKATLRDSVGYIAGAVIALALIWIVCGYAFRAMRAGRSTAEIVKGFEE